MQLYGHVHIKCMCTVRKVLSTAANQRKEELSSISAPGTAPHAQAG